MEKKETTNLVPSSLEERYKDYYYLRDTDFIPMPLSHRERGYSKIEIDYLTAHCNLFPSREAAEERAQEILKLIGVKRTCVLHIPQPRETK